jgi:choline dehydrogenase
MTIRPGVPGAGEGIGMAEDFDYIIVGAGSSGCVLANRLSADPANRVLLIEAGGRNADWLVPIPKGFSKLVLDPAHCDHYAVGQPRGNGVDVKEGWVRGRGLGGSSAINGMIYVRGQPKDFDSWSELAGPEWSWAEMSQVYRAIEDHDLGDDGVRGAGGPLKISAGTMRYPLAERLIEAGEQMGLARKDDLNREDQEGVGYFTHNIRKGRRQSSAVAFLNPVRNRRNLVISTDTLVEKVLFEGRRAVGVAALVKGRQVTFRCRGEVILSAGAMESPRILQLSGIGPGELLNSLGIPVMQDSPDVGARMLEHLGFTATYRLKGDKGLNHRFRGIGLLGSMIQYVATHTGPLATGPLEVGAFVKVHPQARHPDVQLYLGGSTMVRPEGENSANPLPKVESKPGMSIYAQALQLTSEGTIRITSIDPRAPLDIRPNWLSTDYDKEVVVAMMRYIRRYMAQPAIAPFIERPTGPHGRVETDEEILDMFYRQATCGTHGVRSTRMGKDDTAVLDSRCRVRGVDALRVVDCGSMPGLPCGNTNAPAMAVGWRAADLILEDKRLRNAA